MYDVSHAEGKTIVNSVELYYSLVLESLEEPVQLQIKIRATRARADEA